MPSGGLRAAEEATCDASKSEAMHTLVQRASTLSFVKSTLHPDLSTKNCDTVATNIEWDPQRTPLVGAALIQPSSSSATTDIDAAREDDPSTLPSRSQTRAVEVCRTSSSASASCQVASSTLSYLVASFKQSASWARPGGGTRSRS
jgi:hypothetical protein